MTPRDHNFVGNQQNQYDSLRAAGRSAYDAVRWAGGTHEEAMDAGRKAQRQRRNRKRAW